MTTLPPCPRCASVLTYEDRELLVCPECGHEWHALPESGIGDDHGAAPDEGQLIVKDAHGQRLAEGDTVVLIKDLKVKGASSPLKVGTKVRNIRLTTGDHNIDCYIDGFGGMKLKSEFVKKS